MEGRAAGARDLRMGAMPLMMDLANLANQTVPVLDNALLARLVVGVCELVETTREPAQLENLVREIRRTDLSGLASMLIHDIASAEDFVVQTSSARHARVSGTGLIPRDIVTIHGMTVEDASKPPTSRNAEESGERVANKTPSFISTVLSTSNGKTAGHLREVSEKNSRVSAVLIAASGSAPRPALRKKNRLLSTKRTAYSVGDLMCIHNGAFGTTDEVARRLFASFDVGGNVSLGLTEFSQMMQHVIGQELKPQEARGLYNVIENSHDELTLTDFLEFFKLQSSETSNDDKRTRVSVKVGNTVTSVAISLDECFIAFGSMDNHARIYNMLTGASVFERKFKSQVSAVGLSSTGQFMGVGCFGGSLQWLAVDNPDGALHTWEHGKHINTLAVSADDAELAAAGDDNRVTLYSLKSGDVRYVFDALAAVHSVSLAQKEKLKVQLADGTILHNLIDVDFDGSDELENTGTNGHLLSDSTGVRMKTVTRQNTPRQTAGFRRGTVLPRSDTRLLQGQRNSINRLRVKGVIRSVSDVHGSVTIWTALFETLDSVLWTVAMLVLVIVGAIISLLVIQDEEKYDTKTNNDFTAFITYLFMAEVAVRLNSHWRVKGTLTAFFRNPFCVLDLFCSCIDIFLEVLENSSRSGGNSLSRIPAFSSIRLIRMLRLVRLLKAGRVIERVQERVAAKDRRPLYFDITLRNGDEVKHVHRSALVALDAKAMVGLMDEHAHNIDAVDPTGNDAHSWDAGSERGSRIGASSFSDSFQEEDKTDILDASSGNGQDGVSRSPSPTTSPSFRSSSPSISPPYLNTIRCVGDQSDPHHDLSKFGSGSINTAGSPTNGAGTRLNDLSPSEQERSLSRRKIFGGRSNGSPPLGKRPKLSQHLQVGTPVEMLILDATVLETRLSKMVAFGGDSKRVVVYQYDIKPEAEKPPERHKTLAEGAAAAAAAARAPLAPLMAVLPGESPTLGRKGGRESSPGKPDDDASRRRKKSLQTNILPATLLQWAQAADPAKAEIESDDGPLEATIVRMRRPPVKDAETKDADEDKKQASSPTIANRMLARAKAAQEVVQAKSRALFKRADSESGKTAEGVLLEAKIIFRREYTHVLNSVSLSGNTHRLAVGDARGGVHVHDFSTDSEVFSWDDASQVFAVSLSYSGQHLATGGAAKSTHVFDVDSGAEIYNRASRDRLRAVALSRSGQVCLLGGFDGTVNACNIHAGVRIQSFEQHDVVRSVATDAAGVLLAVGCDHGRCALYDLSLGTDISTPPRWAAQHDAKVWVVDISRNGAWVVAGDYNNIVRVYNATDGTALWQKDTWQGKNSPPFTWGLSFSGDSSALAIGHWDSYAYVIDTATWTELVALKRGDRVYSVSMDDEGQRVAVGGRDKTAAVYALQRTASGTLEANSPLMSPSKSPIVQVKRRSLSSGGMSDINESDSENGVIVSIVATINVGAFIYSVSLSGDGRRLAVGTVDDMVGLYSVATQEILHSIRHQGSIQSVKFSPDANFLAVGGEEHAVTVWRLSEDSTVAPRQFLVLPRQSPVHSVAFSDVGLAFASGSLATVYGGLRDYDWTDRPSFEVVADVMEHPNALQTLIEQHPTVLHMKSPLGGESLLQHTVRKRPAQKVEMLLGTGCRFGLIEDMRGHTALMIALKNERKPVVRMLLNTIAASTQDQPAALKQFMRHRVEIAGKYPDLFIEFLQNIDLVEEEDMMPQGHNIAYLKNGTDLTTAGSSEKKPLRFWEDLMEVPLVVDAKSMGPNLASKRSHTVLSSDPTRKTSPRIDGELLRLPEGYKKVEVAAVRVPLVDAVSQTADHIAQPQTTLLFLIAHAAQELDDHHIFSTLIVRSMLQYKWHSYAQFVFHTQFYSFVGLLASTCLSAYSLPRLCMPSFCDDAHKICALCYDDADVLNYYEEGSFNVTRGSSCDRFPRNHLGFAIDPDLTPDRSWSLLWRTSFGQIFLLSFLVALSGSFLGISLEFRQLIVDGRKEYFRDVFKYLDLLAYGCELYVGYLYFLANANIDSVLPVSAWAVLLMCFKTLSFARGFSAWGPLVRMIVKIMVDIKHFLMVMVVLIMAFAMSFTALGDGMVVSLFWVINTGLFQLTPPPDFDAALGSYTDTVTHTKILFLILMVMVALILLNLLIAIMNQTYEDVRRVAALEVAGQKSRIILDIERFMLPVFMDLLDIKLSMIFPRWLHVLVPITMMDEASNGQRRRALAQANAGRQRHDGRS